MKWEINAGYNRLQKKLLRQKETDDVFYLPVSWGNIPIICYSYTKYTVLFLHSHWSKVSVFVRAYPRGL